MTDFLTCDTCFYHPSLFSAFQTAQPIPSCWQIVCCQDQLDVANPRGTWPGPWMLWLCHNQSQFLLRPPNQVCPLIGLETWALPWPESPQGYAHAGWPHHRPWCFQNHPFVLCLYQGFCFISVGFMQTLSSLFCSADLRSHRRSVPSWT